MFETISTEILDKIFLRAFTGKKISYAIILEPLQLITALITTYRKQLNNSFIVKKKINNKETLTLSHQIFKLHNQNLNANANPKHEIQPWSKDKSIPIFGPKASDRQG